MEYFTGISPTLPQSVSCFAFQMQPYILGSSTPCCFLFPTILLYYCFGLVWLLFGNIEKSRNPIEPKHYTSGATCVCVYVCNVCLVIFPDEWKDRSIELRNWNHGGKGATKIESSWISGKLSNNPSTRNHPRDFCRGVESKRDAFPVTTLFLCLLLRMWVLCTSYFYYMWAQRDNISQFFLESIVMTFSSTERERAR